MCNFVCYTISRVVVTHIYEYESVWEYVGAVQRLVKQKNANVPYAWWQEDDETKRVLRMYIHEYLVNRIFNKSEAIPISFLHVMWVFAYIYFDN